MSNDYGVPSSTESHQELDVQRCIEQDDGLECSAIDFFEGHLRKLIKLAASHEKDREIIRLVVLGLVSLTENYFRIVLSDVLRFCPISHELCSKIDIKFISAHYYSSGSIAKALVDGCVFSNVNNICDETKKLTGLDLKDSASVKNALAEFNKVCILRHAAVHSFGRLGGKNAMELGLKQRKNVMVSPSYQALDEICGICQNLVRAYNAFLWKTLISRMDSRGLLKFDDSDADRALFRNMQSIFWERDRLNDDGGATYAAKSAQPQAVAATS